ncbi:MAG: zinc ribbon domain-containing protein [Promethearchaeota archaeon]
MLMFWKKKEKNEPKIKCQKCGAENPLDAKFCLSCGANLEEQKQISKKVKEATDITEDFKDKGGFWAKIIPGYHGYKKKEVRRESDKLLRNHLVSILDRVKNKLSEIQEEVAEDAPDVLGKTEDMLTELDTLLRKIQHADYGYGALFGTTKIKENELDRLLEFDRSMVETVMELDSAMKEFAENPTEETQEKVKALRKMIKKARNFYEQRDEFIVGWTPED